MSNIIPSPNGDTIAICDACGHALAGYLPTDIGYEQWTRETLEGTVRLLTAMNKAGTKLHTAERSDSNLIQRCDCCDRPHETFEFYDILEARYITPDDLPDTPPLTQAEWDDMNTWGAI